MSEWKPHDNCGLVMVVWGLWMGIVFGPYPGEKNFIDKDTNAHNITNKR
jgi:hypothetical protein